jgi:hypothetical protein
MEVLGCGVIHKSIMSNAGRATEAGWAFGIVRPSAVSIPPRLDVQECVCSCLVLMLRW